MLNFIFYHNSSRFPCECDLFTFAHIWDKENLNRVHIWQRKFVFSVNPIQDGHFWGCSRVEGTLPKICHTYPTMMKLGTVIPYLKKIKKIYKSRDIPLAFCWFQRFFNGNQKILLYQEIQIQIAFWYIASNSFNFSWIFKDFFDTWL